MNRRVVRPSAVAANLMAIDHAEARVILDLIGKCIQKGESDKLRV